jgi:hypothetical protein
LAAVEAALQRFFDRHNVGFKKSRTRQSKSVPMFARAPDVGYESKACSTPVVFIDDTATRINMVRLRGGCLREERLVASVPHGHWKTITFVAGLRPMVLLPRL